MRSSFLHRLTVAEIQRAVAEFYGLQPKIMRDPDGLPGAREPRISHPRQVAMFFARTLTPMSYPEIGRRFGGRDHSTVIYAMRAVERRCAHDPWLEIELEALRERLSA